MTQGAIAAVALALAGVLLLRRAWSSRSAGLTAGGWLVLFAGPLGWASSGMAWDKAIAFAALAPSLIALGLLALGAASAPRRMPRTASRRSPIAPPRSAAAHPWAGYLASVICVGPLAGAAALGLAAMVVVHGPGDAADRLVAAELTTPVAWAAGGVWATTDRHTLRVGAGLAAIVAASLFAALL